MEKESRIFNVSKYGLHREIDRAVKSCGLPDICVHGLRHSCASFLQSEELKIPEVVVSAILGHSNTKSMTGRYSHAYEKDLIAVAERLNKIMEDIDNVSEES
ncbi:MAG: tyrosine-type recombinase/integrase [Clostridia bacterium]|nr:tyrosine-type recombinase/integrase [Clostridia bacterium]